VNLGLSGERDQFECGQWDLADGVVNRSETICLPGDRLVTERALTRLEESIDRVVELLRRVRAENSELRAVIQQLKNEAEDLRRENCSKSEIIEKLENDRLEIRSRVEKILVKISTLENPVGEASYKVE